MAAKHSLFVVCCFAFPFSAFAQLDGSALRAKYGEPLARETFRVRPHIEIIVSYGPGRKVCRIELPPDNTKIMVGEALPYIVTKQQVDEVIDELVPPSARGQEIGRSGLHLGIGAVLLTEYQRLTITEPQDPSHPGIRT